MFFTQPVSLACHYQISKPFPVILMCSDITLIQFSIILFYFVFLRSHLRVIVPQTPWFVELSHNPLFLDSSSFCADFLNSKYKKQN